MRPFPSWRSAPGRPGQRPQIGAAPAFMAIKPCRGHRTCRTMQPSLIRRHACPRPLPGPPWRSRWPPSAARARRPPSSRPRSTSPFPTTSARWRSASDRSSRAPRLGAVTRYEEDGASLAAGGVTVGVYVYTGGLEHVSSDLDSTVMRGHFHSVIDEVKSMEQLGKVKSVTLPSGGELEPPASPAAVRSFSGNATRSTWTARTRWSSATYLTSMKDHFVKLRISYRRGDVVSALLAENFVGGHSQGLGGCARPEPPPREPAATSSAVLEERLRARRRAPGNP